MFNRKKQKIKRLKEGIFIRDIVIAMLIAEIDKNKKVKSLEKKCSNCVYDSMNNPDKEGYHYFHKCIENNCFRSI